MQSNKLVEIKNLKKYFKTPKGMLHAVDDITLDISEGKTLGVVGESGCGKSTTGRLAVNLLTPTSGEILFNGKNLSKINKNEMKEIRKEMQMIFQDPFASLNPRKTVSETIAEPLRIHKICNNKSELNNRVKELMDTVGLSQRLINTYPHELDGGRRQRVGIARAIALEPSFIVCDEPVSALDVSIQAQVLNLLNQLQKEKNLTYMFITHDLSVVRFFSDDIAVMYLGQLVEKASASELFLNPTHPYTEALLSAIPVPRLRNRPKRIILEGEIVTPINPKRGCRFASRCIHKKKRCEEESPQLRDIGNNHFISCHVK
ncbi:ATP-binding cassette domain-containing protein [Clostridiaceae bacterium M8S5]|nr:ATP-binding cassette domain-containing protein [Clostridiaceae bacterium M8S5]